MTVTLRCVTTRFTCD